MDPRALDDFRLLETLTETEGFTVHAAEDVRTAKTVRLIQFSAAVSGNVVFRTAFRRDERSLTECEHLQIPRVLGRGDDYGKLFLVTEPADGVPLAQRLANGQVFSPDEVTDLAWQIASALRP